MKSHELAKNLDSIAALLKSLPNSEIAQTIKFLQQLVDDDKGLKKDRSKGREAYTALPDGVIEKLHNMTLPEAEKYLETDVAFVSTASILRLSSALGIQTSKRQNRTAVINSIIRHLEAKKMGSIIRNEIDIESEIPVIKE
ncbi:hypothetical protein RAM80_18795 [Pseudomonas sp. App30]|uniref:hypothetical protein n=1 Tax=Pseudomonas sp. App30 TaxID=3068990 RepID=UPI003A80B939